MLRHTDRRGAAVFLLFRSCLTILGCLFALALPTVHAQGSDTQQKLQSIQAHIEHLTRQLETAQGKRGKLEADLRQAEQEIAGAADALHKTRARITRERVRLSALDRKAARQQQAVQGQINALRAQIDSAYRMGRQPAIKLFLNQQNPAMLGRMLGYYDYINHARQRLINHARKELAALIETRQAVNAQRLRLKKTLAAEQTHQAALKRAEQARRQALARIDAVIGHKRDRLKTLKSNARRLQSLLSSVGHAAANDATLNALSQVPFGRLHGRLPWPTPGHLLVRFNTPRAGSLGTLRWQGVFIGAPKGQAVRAIDAGRVVFANWLRGYGLLLIIDHGHGFMSLYGHDEAIYRPVGSWVRAGEIVASVGNSGGQNRYGLYFAIRHDGQPLDPSSWCRGKPALAGK